MKQEKTILIDVSLTGGRGPAKKTYEFVERCKERGVKYKILTNRDFEFKLRDIGVKADYVIDAGFQDSDQVILDEYYRLLRSIDFDFLFRLGARIGGAEAALRLGKPYMMADGGMPDPKWRLYKQDVYNESLKFIVTTQFPWDIPRRFDKPKIETGYYPISHKTLNFISLLRTLNKEEILKDAERLLPGLKQVGSNLLINLVMTGDFLINPLDRKTYGGWMWSREYDQCVGWLRRFFTDLGEFYKKEIFIFVDREIFDIVGDLLAKYKNIKILTYQDGWDYKLEIILKRLADINISRATNYQPYIALLANGGSVTTPVPADGYMDEDVAGIQYADLGLTKLIEYDDENYVRKLLDFAQDKKAQEKISQQMKEVCWKFLEERNVADLVIDEFNKL